MFVLLSIPLGAEELGLLPTCYTQGTASIIVICSSVWLRHAAILGPIPRDPRCGDNRNVLARVVNKIYSILSRLLLLTRPCWKTLLWQDIQTQVPFGSLHFKEDTCQQRSLQLGSLVIFDIVKIIYHKIPLITSLLYQQSTASTWPIRPCPLVADNCRDEYLYIMLNCGHE